MKLLLCLLCGDIVTLKVGIYRTCECGECGGQYDPDGLHATVEGPNERSFMCLGFANGSFEAAISKQYHEGNSKEVMPYGFRTVTKGRDFAAFIIPTDAPTVEFNYKS